MIAGEDVADLGDAALPLLARRDPADRPIAAGQRDRPAAPTFHVGARREIVAHFLDAGERRPRPRSEEHTSELQSLMRISYAVFCLKKKNQDELQHLVRYKLQHKTRLITLLEMRPTEFTQNK